MFVMCCDLILSCLVLYLNIEHFSSFQSSSSNSHNTKLVYLQPEQMHQKTSRVNLKEH
jgi:hypothetical protein